VKIWFILQNKTVSASLAEVNKAKKIFVDGAVMLLSAGHLLRNRFT
jgi:hypothetical protein